MSTSRAVSTGSDDDASQPSLAALSFLRMRQDNVFPDHVYSRWARFCPTALGLFGTLSPQIERETVFLRLLCTALNAIPESYEQADFTKLAAIAILNRHPELLFQDGMITDRFGRRIEASPYQLFLGAGDVWALRQVHEQILPKIENGQAQAEAQFRAQFPECPLPFTANTPEAALYDDRNRKQIADVTKQLNVIVGAITEDPCTNGFATRDETKEAIDKLRQLFAPKKDEVIQTGLHFPIGMMKEIYSVYAAQFSQWSGAQKAFFSREVIGSVEKALTGVDGQCVKTGIGNLDMDKGPDRLDGLLCPDPKGIPKELTPLIGQFGRTLFIDPVYGEAGFASSSAGLFDWFDKNGWRASSRLRWRAVQPWLASWKTYGEQKQKLLGDIMRPQFDASTYHHDEHNPPWQCVML